MELQQYLPFTVLKRDCIRNIIFMNIISLQQYLPFTVLKPKILHVIVIDDLVATVLTVYGIETDNAA